MCDLALRAKRCRRYKVTTDSRHLYPVAANVLDRKFDVAEANRIWACDITCVWTLQGWLYLAAAMDLFSHQIVGWAMDNHMETKLTLDALAMAYWRRKPPKGLLHHSDRGSQYGCHEYQKQLQHYGMIANMCRKEDCRDNAPLERFFGSLKSESLVTRSK
jgi:transposase InsO family protein